MRINSLLIAERILGSIHKDVIFRIMYRGAAYADSSHYMICIRLWRYALQLRIQKDSLLYGDTCFTALALVRLFLDLHRNSDLTGSTPVRIDDLFGTFQLLIEQLPTCAENVRVRPVYKRQQESYDRCLRCCTHILHLLIKIKDKSFDQQVNLRQACYMLLRYNLRMCSSGDTLLHMAVSRNNIVRSHFFVDEHQVHVFPSYDVTEFLISCGADINAVNDNRALPLHHAVQQEGIDPKIVNLLLKHGSHVDQLDNANQNPLDILRRRPGFPVLEHISLKCMAAKAVCESRISYTPQDLPRELCAFVAIHCPTAPEEGQGRSHRNNGGRPHRSH